jgi:3-phenylpropionate/trans-cinnamate dioxygenase ferredoxin reductase component
VNIVVVGAGLAGANAVEELRAQGYSDDITLIGAEPHLPYERPPLSKAVLLGDAEPDSVFVHDPGWYDEQRIEVLLETPAESIELEGRRVAVAGRAIPYDRLLLATGATPRRLRLADESGALVAYLRTRDDSRELKERLSGRVLIVGAGWIGLEVAAAARIAGAEVTVVEMADQPLQAALGPEVGSMFADLHREHGVDLRLGTSVANVGATAVELADGSRVEADVVIAALGAIPNTGWLKGLTLDRGLACDATLTSLSDPDVLGAGDAISWPHPLAGERVRVEHWTVAAGHGQLAGRNALLEPHERRGHDIPPYFWSDQYDVKIQAVGFPALAERLEILEADGNRLVAAGQRDGRLIGVVAFNAAKRLGWYRRQLASHPLFEDIKHAVREDEKALVAT